MQLDVPFALLVHMHLLGKRRALLARLVIINLYQGNHCVLEPTLVVLVKELLLVRQ
jgi:hypothetical protein